MFSLETDRIGRPTSPEPLGRGSLLRPSRRWWLRCGGRTYAVAQRWDLQAGEAERICLYVPGLLRRALGDPFSCRTLYEICLGVGASEQDLRMGDSGSRIMLELERRFRRGQLVLLGDAQRFASGGGGAGIEKEASAPGPPEPTTRPAKKKETTWIEIALIDDRKRPVPFEAYVVTLPDGRERRGSLDEDGKAYISGIDPGSCGVSFPYLHADEWRPA